MMHDFMNILFPLGLLCNYIGFWCLWKIITAQSEHLDSLSALVIEITDSQLKAKYPNVVLMSSRVKKE